MIKQLVDLTKPHDGKHVPLLYPWSVLIWDLRRIQSWDCTLGKGQENDLIVYVFQRNPHHLAQVTVKADLHIHLRNWRVNCASSVSSSNLNYFRRVDESLPVTKKFLTFHLCSYFRVKESDRQLKKMFCLSSDFKPFSSALLIFFSKVLVTSL
jgi:hypothetical protein